MFHRRKFIVLFFVISFFYGILTALTPQNTKTIERNFDTLRHVQIIFRHGARAPVRPYPTSPYKNQSLYWPEGWTQLTKVGFEQQLELGKYLRKRYDGFLSRKYNHFDFHCLSSDVDRAIQSAVGNLEGLYKMPSSGDEKINSEWQPVPIHTIPTDTDIWINNEAPCPRFSQYLHEVYYALPSIQKFDKENYEFINLVVQKAGLSMPISARSLSQVQDALRAERFQNFTLPEWATDDVCERLDYIKALSFEWKLSSDEMKRLKSGPLIGSLINNFKISSKALSNETMSRDIPFQDEEPFRKIRIFSGHDSTIANLMITWGLYERQIPNYAAALILELHKEPTSPEFKIEVYYRNDTSREPYVLRIRECGTPCYLSRLETLSSRFIPKDWAKECQAQISPNLFLSFEEPLENPFSSGLSAFDSIVFLCLLIFGMTFILAALHVWKWKQRTFVTSDPVNTYETFHRL